MSTQTTHRTDDKQKDCLFQKLSREENETLTKFDHEIRPKMDELSQKMFGINIVPAFNWMMLQSLHNPDNAMDMYFANNNPVKMFKTLSDINLQEEIRSMAENFKATHLKNISNQMQSIDNMLSALWFSKLPCFDVEGITSDVDGEAGLLKLCKWKGKKIPCFRIFKKVTTDQGICCAFNMDGADKIHVKSQYSEKMKNLQKLEEELAFQGGNMSGWELYLKYKEPKSQSGNKMGLTVVLDAHTDLVSEYTIDSDFKEITAAIISSGDFPLTSQNSIKIKPGHNNIISIIPTQISSEGTIRTIDANKRKCIFQDETHFLKLHQNYSQINCLFECSLAQAKNINNVDCNPWFFPLTNSTERVCDPWEKNKVIEAMQNDVGFNSCEHCLPDCDRTVYQPVITTLEFRVCDEKNFGMTELCSFDAIDVWPQIWGDQVLSQTSETFNSSRILSKIKSRKRAKTLFYSRSKTVLTPSEIYDAYTDDIAVVNVYFSSPTVMQFKTRINKTWIDFISGIGGNVGLFIGFSFVTIFELIWLFIRVLAVYFEPLSKTNIEGFNNR